MLKRLESQMDQKVQSANPDLAKLVGDLVLNKDFPVDNVIV